MPDEVYRRAQGERVDKDRTYDRACANRQWNQDRDSMNLRHPSARSFESRRVSECLGYISDDKDSDWSVSLPGAQLTWDPYLECQTS
jgi:hypothetical protein